MEHPKKELIEGIAELFEAHEEIYVPGEWEAFSQQQQRKKYPFFAQWVKIAAVLFLIFSVLFFSLSRKPEQQENIVKVKATPVLPSTGQMKSTGVTTVPPKAAAGSGQGVLSGRSPADQQRASLAPAQHGQELVLQTVMESLTAAVNTPVYTHEEVPLGFQKKELLQDTAAQQKKEGLSTIDFLIAESKKPATEQKKKEIGSKWDFGVEVMPTMTQKNMNVGGGLTTAYRLSDKLAISSGISLLQLQSGVSVGGSAGAMDMSVARALSDRELTSVNANIKAIDIPLGLVYKINKHYYTSAGVSYFNVITEKRSNTYVQTAQINQSVNNALTGASYSYKAVVSEQVSENVPDEPLRGNSYLGFFNFSVGRKQTLFNKYNIRIEPFIKVPVGKLSDQELKLMNSGLKLQLSF